MVKPGRPGCRWQIDPRSPKLGDLGICNGRRTIPNAFPQKEEFFQIHDPQDQELQVSDPQEQGPRGHERQEQGLQVSERQDPGLQGHGHQEQLA